MHHSQKLQNHYNKYGESDLVFIVIEPCFTEFLIIREQYYFDLLHPILNTCPVAGNCLGAKHSDATKEKMSQSRKGHRGWNKGKKGLCKHTEEHKRKMSLLKKGIPRSEETKRRVSEALKGKMAGERNPFYGKTHPPEIMQKIIEANKGKTPPNKGKKGLLKHTEEWKQKRSEDMSGENNPMYGKTHSAEARKKISDSHKGKKMSETSRLALLKANTGRKPSEETLQKYRDARIRYYQNKKLLEQVDVNLN